MTLKYSGASGTGFTSDAIQCIEFAIDNGAHVINASWGGYSYSEALLDAIVAAQQAGIIFIAAAGNETINNDTDPLYPASYDVDNVISVASSDRNDALSSFSNYGKTSVHLAAPGEAITSTWFTNDSSYLENNGTSMAAPHVAGAAALLMSLFPSDDYSDIRKRILESVDEISAFEDYLITGGRLNIAAAMLVSLPQRALAHVEWPATIPLPFYQYSGRERNTTIASSNPEMSPLIDRRSRLEKAYVTLEVTWNLTDSQYEDFKEFFQAQLDEGASAFGMELRYPYNSTLTYGS
jgi:subtilisin family serine protease